MTVLSRRSIGMLLCAAAMALGQPSSAQAGIIPWMYNAVFGYGPVFPRYAARHGYGPTYAYNTAAYGGPVYDGGYTPAVSPCGPGGCGGSVSYGYAPAVSPCGPGGCGASVSYGPAVSPCGPGGCGTSVSYGVSPCGPGGCGVGGCGGACGVSDCCGTTSYVGYGYDGCNSCCGSCGYNGCGAGGCSNCVATPANLNTTNPTADPNPTQVTPRPLPTDDFNRSQPDSTYSPNLGAPASTFGNQNNGVGNTNNTNANPGGTGGFTQPNPVGGAGSTVPNNTLPNNTVPNAGGSSTIPRAGTGAGFPAEAFPETGNTRGPANADPGGTSGGSAAPPFAPKTNQPFEGEGRDLYRPKGDGTSQVPPIDGPVAHSFDAHRSRSRLFTSARPLTVARVAVRSNSIAAEQVASK